MGVEPAQAAAGSVGWAGCGSVATTLPRHSPDSIVDRRTNGGGVTR
jgi:hypothetical protein